MHRSLKAISLIGAMAVSGCTADNPGFFVQSAVVLDEQCSFNTGSDVMSNGSLDLGYSMDDGNGNRTGFRSYSIPLILQSRVISRNQGTRSAPRADAGSIVVQGAVIRLLQGAPQTDKFVLLTNGQNEIPEYTVPATAFVPTARDAAPGLGPLYLEAIPVSMTNALYKYTEAKARGTSSRVPVVMGVRLYGETVGGQSIEADEWYWPMELCIGCLQGALPDEGVCTPGANEGAWEAATNSAR